MQRGKAKLLEQAEWKVGNVQEFLDLTEEETAFVELKLALSDRLRELRAKQHWTQTQLARRLRSSQSRVAKMEAADPSVTVDLLVKSLLTLGTSREELGKVIASRRVTP